MKSGLKMLPEAAGQGLFSRLRSQFFSLNGPTSRAITNIALGSEIKKHGRVTSPIIISFYSGAERCKIKTWISIIAAEKNLFHIIKS